MKKVRPTAHRVLAAAAAAAAAAMLTFALGGCAGDDSSDEPVTLSLWHVYGSQTASPLNTLVDEFNATVGADEGIAVVVTSVTDSNSIDEALSASVANEPGSGPMPDLFTAYPRAAEVVGTDLLLDWSSYLSSEEIDLYVDEFVAEGYFGDRLLVLPIAKSTEMLFLNETLFDRYAAESGASRQDLASFDTLFALCEAYAAWSDGHAFMQIDDLYFHFLAAAAANGSSFASPTGLSCDGSWFEQAWMPLARAAIAGGLDVGDGFASDRWQTGEILCTIGSTASVLYLRDTVGYADGTTEAIVTDVLPYPIFPDKAATVSQRGVGLLACASDDERKNQAIASFARWITLHDVNAEFATEAGYLPVTEKAFGDLSAYAQAADNDKYRLLYETAASYTSYQYCSSPFFEGAAVEQKRFEETVQTVLENAREDYLARIQEEDAEHVMRELVASSLVAMRTAW